MIISIPPIVKETMPLIRGIYLTKTCISRSYYHSFRFTKSGTITAHAHMCPKDYYYSYICMTEKFVLNSDGSIADLMWHEYGHILHDRSSIMGKCLKGHEISPEVWEKDEHGEEWQKIMIGLGKPHLAKMGRYTNRPY